MENLLTGLTKTENKAKEMINELLHSYSPSSFKHHHLEVFLEYVQSTQETEKTAKQDKVLYFKTIWHFFEQLDHYNKMKRKNPR